MDGSFSDISGRYQHGRTDHRRSDVRRWADRQGGVVRRRHRGQLRQRRRLRSRRRRSPWRVWLKGRGNLPMSVFQKLDDPQHRRGYEWRFEDVTLVGIQKYAAQLTIHVRVRCGQRHPDSHARPAARSGQWYHVTLTYDGSGKGVRPQPLRRRPAYDVDVQQDTLDRIVRARTRRCASAARRSASRSTARSTICGSTARS